MLDCFLMLGIQQLILTSEMEGAPLLLKINISGGVIKIWGGLLLFHTQGESKVLILIWIRLI
ncbi:hypothetical protein EVK82_26425 [Salmonella enterica]|nr:hypothetical protein [Salmonella enterica]